MIDSYINSLEKFSEADWLNALESLSSAIHEVDRIAVQVWFRFYPLDLLNYLETSDDLESAMKGVAMQGDFGLLDKIDSSHSFLYGHRFWSDVRASIIERAGSTGQVSGLKEEIEAVAGLVAKKSNAKESLTLAISAVGLMTLVQSGADAFQSAGSAISKPKGILALSPDQIVKERAKDDSQGLFGFLKTVDKKFSVHFNSFKSDGRFPIISDEEIASASQKDHSRDWQALDDRCWDGPVPIECTSASCGTCWIGVIGGREKLSVPSSLEKKRMTVFGYGQTDEEKPFVRLACQAKATGNVSIVIPPWNAVFGKKVRGNVADVELEPVTTSAKRLREITASALSDDSIQN